MWFWWRLLSMVGWGLVGASENSMMKHWDLLILAAQRILLSKWFIIFYMPFPVQDHYIFLHKVGLMHGGVKKHSHFRETYSFQTGFLREYCNWEIFKANCTHGHVIMMTEAKYGRMKFGRCIRKTYDDSGKPVDVGCKQNIIKYGLVFSSYIHFTANILLASNVSSLQM